MSNIDKNRISLSQTDVMKKRDLLPDFFRPICKKDVPMYSTTELKSITVDTTSEQNSEELVDLRDFGIRTLPYYREEAFGNPTYNSNIEGAPDIIYARLSVAKKLEKVNKELDKLGLEVIVYDAQRSPATQKKLYMHFLQVAYNKGLKGQEAHNLASQYCSNPEGFDKNNPKTWTMHSTGAAIDLYLVDKKTKKVIDMGEGYFDNPDEKTNTLYYEEQSKKRELSEAEKNALYARRILFNAMKKAGFYNYGSELFHYELNGLIEAKVKSEQYGRPFMASYGYKPSPADTSKANILDMLYLNAKKRENNV